MVSKKTSTSSSRAAAPTASTVLPSQLGLTNGEEIATFQRHQQIALSRANNNNARTAAANGRVLVDASSLQLLANHFDHVMAGIQRRADLVSTCQMVFLVVCVHVLLSCLLDPLVLEHASLVCLVAWSCDTHIPSQAAMLLEL